MFKTALKDFKNSLKYSHIWIFNAIIDTKQRYRRSILGPFWITLSLAIFVFSIGLLWAKLFKTNVANYMPYFCVGMVLWTYISGICTESCLMFIQNKNIIQQIDLPISSYAFSLTTKRFIIFLHNFVVFFGIAIFFKIPFLKTSYLIIPGFAIYFFTSIWLSILFGIICARFRDVVQIVPSIVQISFFTTPIIWKMDNLLGKKAMFLNLNPIYHFIEIMRGPLLGYTPSLLNYTVAISVSIIGFIFTFLIFAKYRKRIVYWI